MQHGSVSRGSVHGSYLLTKPCVKVSFFTLSLIVRVQLFQNKYGILALYKQKRNSWNYSTARKFPLSLFILRTRIKHDHIYLLDINCRHSKNITKLFRCNVAVLFCFRNPRYNWTSPLLRVHLWMEQVNWSGSIPSHKLLTTKSAESNHKWSLSPF